MVSSSLQPKDGLTGSGVTDAELVGLVAQDVDDVKTQAIETVSDP